MRISKSKRKNIKDYVLVICSIFTLIAAALISGISPAGGLLLTVLSLISFPPLYKGVRKKSKRRVTWLRRVSYGILIALLLLVFPHERNTSDRLKQADEQLSKTNATTDKNETTEASLPDFAENEEGLEVIFMDVGQADCSIIVCDGVCMVFDCGSNDMGTKIQKELFTHGIDKVDVVVISHYDEDHCGSADVLIEKSGVERVYAPLQEKDTKSCQDVKAALRQMGLSPVCPEPGSMITIGGAMVTFIAPAETTYEDINNSSIAILLEYNSYKFIFTGDCEELAEEEILQNTSRLGIDVSDCDVYQVGHHGSATSSSDGFLRVINPRYAVISCGKGNKYGHPHKATLDKFKMYGTSLYRTDEQGTICCYVKGQTMTWSVEPTDNWEPGAYPEE